jgi:(1->4)-alpha-D-glucan 1-alpha-D-glucosylmutase
MSVIPPSAAQPTQPPPFEPITYKAQRLYCELFGSAFAELRKRAEAGEENVGRWLERFLALGEQLGVPVDDLASERPAAAVAPAAALIEKALTGRRVPTATYRLQFNPHFTFQDACDLVSYLHALGISDCYASPVLRASAGSSHGYDVCDHSRLNPDLGGEEGFEAFAAALRAHGMGLILDAVPNHMGIADTSNAWWMDILENGPGSPYAPFFDIDWHPANPDLDSKVLLPLLEDQYGCVLEAGKIRLAYDRGAFSLCYHQTQLPVAPCTYPAVLEQPLAALARSLPEGHGHLRELRSVLTALRYLPPRTELSSEKIAERHREKEVIKARLAALYAASPEVREAIGATVLMFNGTVGQPRSFDRLDALIERQAYRLAFWRVAGEEINYRRFFDVNELAAIRMELPEVFHAAHQVLFHLLAEGHATGLRIDHPDGLRDPASYFRQLQEQYILARARVALPAGLESYDLARAVAVRLAASGDGSGDPVPRPLYVVAEKILTEGESLPADWAVDGTTGYDFLNAVHGLFVDAESRDAFDRVYTAFVGPSAGFDQLVNSAKKMTMLVSMASEINALAHQLDRIAERNRCCRDFTLNSLTFALREMIACLPVYRTYITGPEAVSPRDSQVIGAAAAEAKRRNPRTAERIFDFVHDAVLLRGVQDFPEADRPRLVEWALKFQQLTGPIMAKSVEDTVFYTYNRLASLNEVGGAPDRYGVSVAAFHRQNAERQEHWPHSLLATSTHDTKRSEDVRARLGALSELPQEWQAALGRWARLNAPKKSIVDDQPAPSRNDEYLLYQTLLGAWPADALTDAALESFRSRIAAYMQKATKEAKVHTSWINPNEEYDAAVRQFVEGLLPEGTPESDPFLADLAALQRRVAFFGYFNSLSQVLLKLTCPGVPDLYQGTELWDLSLVDPDNRRPVDYGRRRELLADLQERIGQAGDDLTTLTAELLACLPDGRVKAYVTYQTLRFRREHENLFIRGAYLPLEATGGRYDHVCAFARSTGNEVILVVVPRLVVGLAGGAERPPLGAEIWGKTRLLLPPSLEDRSYRNIFTGETVTPANLDGAIGPLLALTLGRFPVALLCG